MKQCTVLAIILLLIGAFLVPILSFEIKRSIDQGIGIHRNRIIQKEYHLYPTRVKFLSVIILVNFQEKKLIQYHAHIIKGKLD